MIELLSNAEMVEADRLAIAAGTAGIELMERAGEAVADAVTACLPAASRVVVVAGPGNNGGDGFVAARLLAGRGYRVRVLVVGEAERIKGDAALAAKRWGGPLAPADPEGLAAAGDAFDLVIDALFGAGLDRPVDGLPRAMIESMNAQPAPILAVDLPSGINGTSGADHGDRRRSLSDRNVLSQEARASPSAGTQPLWPGFGCRHRNSRIRAGADCAADLREPPRALARKLSACRGSAGTNTTAATRWSFPVLRGRPAPRGSPHEVPCAPERDWSRLQARVKRWPSMPRQTLPSWCGRWTDRTN